MKKILTRRMEALSDPSEVSGAWDLGLKMAILQWISDWKDIRFGGKFKSQICQILNYHYYIVGVIFASHCF